MFPLPPIDALATPSGAALPVNPSVIVMGIVGVLVVYGALRHRALSVKVIVAEVAVLGLTLILFINIFLSDEASLGLVGRFLIFLAFAIVGGFFTTSIITIEKQEHELRQLTAKSKTEFISIAAHQLRTPLSIIKWAIATLLAGDQGALTAEQEESLGRVRVTNERMIDLVNDLLDIAQIEDGKFGFTFTVRDLTATIRAVMNEYTALAKERRIVFTLDTPPMALPPIAFDRTKLPAAVHGLIDNAFHYTKEGGSITVSLAVVDASVEIRVADTGIGVPAQEMDRLFTKFFRSENAIHMAPNGSGLGLFIVKNIVERHGGTVAVESTEGTGSRFMIRLPVQGSGTTRV